MRVEVQETRRLVFDDGAPVRAASAVVPYRDGRLVVQDDGTHAAWVRPGGVQRLRVLPPVEGHDVFAAASGNKRLKPDLEAACAVAPEAVLLLGSGSSPQRTRAVLLGPEGTTVRDLAALYDAVGAALETPPGALNLEGACVVDGRLRWFRRGAAHVPSASVDLDLAALLAAVRGEAAPEDVQPTRPVRYELGQADGVDLAVTDAVALRDGRVLVSLAAEDTPDPVEDGPVVGAALALLEGERVVAAAELPEPDGVVHKVEGLAVVEEGDELALVAVVDDDDATAASVELRLRVEL